MARVSLDIDLNEFAWDITSGFSVSDREIIGFIKEIDTLRGDWSFTNKLYKYFKKEMKRARKDGWTND